MKDETEEEEEVVALSVLASGKGPLSEEEIVQARRWVDADWESHDIERDAVNLIDRLLQTVTQGIKK